MALLTKVDFKKYSPIWIPMLLAGVKFMLLALRDVQNMIYFYQTAGIIAFSGASFYMWAFTNRFQGRSVQQKEVGKKKLSQEGFILIIFALFQLMLYIWTLIVEPNYDYEYHKIMIIAVGSVTYGVPYSLIKGYIV